MKTKATLRFLIALAWWGVLVLSAAAAIEIAYIAGAYR